MNSLNLSEIAILLLAGWRIASLLADEKGPKDMFWHFRSLLGVREEKRSKITPDGQTWEWVETVADNVFGQMIMCIWCNSFWVGVFLTALYALNSDYAVALALPFAVSAFSIGFSKRIAKYA